jgi:hypothetical protein
MPRVIHSNLRLSQFARLSRRLREPNCPSDMDGMVFPLLSYYVSIDRCFPASSSTSFERLFDRARQASAKE